MSDKKIFIVTPRGGLCNQLVSITNGIIFSNYFNRDVHFNGFQLDYKNPDEYIAFEKILNFKKLQKSINDLDLKVNIIIEVDYNKKYKMIENANLCIKDMCSEINKRENKNIDILNIGNLLNVNLPPNDVFNYPNISNILNTSFEFSEYYDECVNYIKKSLNLKQYACVHMRLEDDAINYFSEYYKINKEDYNKNTQNNYIKEIDDIKNNKKTNKKIYICSSLIIQDNMNNDFYREIKKKYSLVDKNHLINKDDINKYRELYAIIDFIIAKDADYFIGNNPSSFSHFINNYFKVKNKESKMI